MSHEEQQEFRDWLRDALARIAPLSISRRLVEEGRRTDPGLHTELAESGFLGLAVPEIDGGAGVDDETLALALQESGRVLLPAAYLVSSFVIPKGIVHARDAALRAALLEGISSGAVRVALADVDDPSDPVLIAPDGALSGAKAAVIDADASDEFLVIVEGEEGPRLRLVAREHVKVDDIEPLDPSRPAATVRFALSPSRPLDVDDPSHVATVLRSWLSLALAAELAGGIARCLELSVDYVKLREQFGKPIGAFQAIKHRCADMFVASQATSAAVLGAARTSAQDDRIVTATAVYVAEQAMRVAEDTLQLHGGIAFTWEHEAHFYVTRAKSTQVLLRASGRSRERIAHELLEGRRTVIDSLAGDVIGGG
jgi:alkylation response protein AidB-like acyl-CoA dehydrogenase